MSEPFKSHRATSNDAAKFGVYAFGKVKNPNAIEHYRLITPLRGLHKLGLANIYLDDRKSLKDLGAKALISSDVALGWNVTDNVVDSLKYLSPIPHGDDMLYPPVVVADMDDAIEFVHPFNYFAYPGYGIKNWDGKELEPGDSLALPSRNGTQRLLWEDKVTEGINGEIFDIARNKKNIENHFTAYKKAHGVTVTTKYLADLYRDRGCENVYVFPNSVMESDYYFPRLSPHKGVRILWEGGASHIDSWMPVKDALIEILRENPHVTLVVFGEYFPWLDKEVPDGQLEFHEWVDHSAYKIKRKVLGCDINLCPLVDSPFTRAKSAIRWYEASLGPHPEATLAANVGPYQEIEDGRTGLLYDNSKEFAMKLKELIKNVELRKMLGSNAHGWVTDNRSVEQTVPGLYEFYQELKAKQRQEALVS